MTTTYLGFEERRSVILAAGVKIANRNGLVAASMTHVADTCLVKTSVATVRDHFRTKGDLWRAIAEHPEASKDVKASAVSMGLTDSAAV